MLKISMASEKCTVPLLKIEIILLLNKSYYKYQFYINMCATSTICRNVSKELFDLFYVIVDVCLS